MGPPPPPPPPPPLKSAAVLPPGGWKTANAPRRDNNPVPASPAHSRPHVDSSALLHAASRLRKTGYNEQIRDDVSNLPDGRVDRPDQRAAHGDRTDRPQQHLVDQHQAREQVYAPGARAYHTDTLSHLHRYANPLSGSEKSAAAVSATASPLARSDFDRTPKSLFQTFNNPSSETFIEKTIDAPHTIPPSYNNNSTYSVNRETTIRTVSPYSSSTVFNYSSSATVSPYSAAHPTLTNHTRTSNTYTSSTSPRETNLEWTTPYVAGHVAAPILDPRARIHEFATQNYVQEDDRRQYSTSPRPQPTQSAQTTTRTNQQTFSKELRDQGLTPSQRAANQCQQSRRRSDMLPFDVNQIVQSSYKGDEVDSLVSRMASDLRGATRTFENVPQRRTNVMQDNNICVACKSEITADKPGCTALDQIFHVSCFNCKRCGRVLAGASFYNIDDDPICEGCYQDSLDKCTKCGKSISDKLLRACGGTFHVDCFTCVACEKPLDGIPFTVDSDNRVHCVPCFHEKFAPRCAVCSKGIVPVEGEKESVRVVAMDKSFHVQCYRCEDCGLQLSSKIEGQGCYPLDAHLYCKTCNSNRLRMASA